MKINGRSNSICAVLDKAMGLAQELMSEYGYKTGSWCYAVQPCDDNLTAEVTMCTLLEANKLSEEGSTKFRLIGCASIVVANEFFTSDWASKWIAEDCASVMSISLPDYIRPHFRSEQ